MAKVQVSRQKFNTYILRLDQNRIFILYNNNNNNNNNNDNNNFFPALCYLANDIFKYQRSIELGKYIYKKKNVVVKK